MIKGSHHSPETIALYCRQRQGQRVHLYEEDLKGVC